MFSTVRTKFIDWMEMALIAIVELRFMEWVAITLIAIFITFTGWWWYTLSIVFALFAITMFVKAWTMINQHRKDKQLSR